MIIDDLSRDDVVNLTNAMNNLAERIDFTFGHNYGGTISVRVDGVRELNTKLDKIISILENKE